MKMFCRILFFVGVAIMREARVSTYQEGQHVRHGQYGLGTILETDEERTSIDFVDHGTKKFVTSIVVLEITDEQPARKTRKRRARGTGKAKAKK